MANLTSSKLDLYCWTGRWDEEPTSQQYTIQKNNPDSNNTIRFEISELVQDYIDVVFNNNYSEGSIKTACWWRYDKTNTYSDLTYTTIHTGYGIGTKGYTYFQDGINSTNSLTKLISNQHIYLPEGQEINLPVYKGPGGAANVVFYSKDSAGVEGQSHFDDSALYAEQPKGPEDANSLIKYISITGTFTKIEITSASKTETIFVNYLDCSKYENYKIAFINKFGAIQDLWFNKKRTDALNVKRDSFDTSTIYSSTTALNFNTYDATSIVQDVTSKKSLTLNTGYLKEEYNETIRQLMQSENVWIVENGNSYPVSIKDSSFNYKTHLNDKLVNYTVQFEYAFNSINSVR